MVLRGSRRLQPAFLIRVYDAAGNVIETHEHTGDFQRVVNDYFDQILGFPKMQSVAEYVQKTPHSGIQPRCGFLSLLISESPF